MPPMSTETPAQDNALSIQLETQEFPFSTLIINLLGCLGIGLAYAIWENNNNAKLLLVIGFLGGFLGFWLGVGVLQIGDYGLHIAAKFKSCFQP